MYAWAVGYGVTLPLVICSIVDTVDGNMTLLIVKVAILFCFTTHLSYYMKFLTKIIVYEKLLNNKDAKYQRDFDLMHIASYWERNVSESDKLWVEGRIQSCKDFWYMFNYYMGIDIMLFMSGYMSHETAKPFEQSGSLHFWLALGLSFIGYTSLVILLSRTFSYCYVRHKMKIMYGKGQKQHDVTEQTPS